MKVNYTISWNTGLSVLFVKKFVSRYSKTFTRTFLYKRGKKIKGGDSDNIDAKDKKDEKNEMKKKKKMKKDTTF